VRGSQTPFRFQNYIKKLKTQKKTKNTKNANKKLEKKLGHIQIEIQHQLNLWKE